ncbi:MAG: nitroreductase family protein [bacterium]|nr:nitroreductase family protein [bacterium]
MSETVFDQKLCVKCDICSEVCPVGIIDKPNAAAYPVIADASKANCIQCGQCEVFCPYEAVEVKGAELQKAAKSQRQPAITPEQIAFYFSMRRSIRRYKQQPVDRQTLEQILDIVRFAPSGVNHQPLSWIVIYSTAELKKLTGMVIDVMRQLVKDKSPIASMMGFQNMVSAWENGGDFVCRHAPHLLIAHARKDNRIAPIDATIALAHFELAAPAFGLGACWAGYFSIVANLSPVIRKAAGIPDDHVQLGSMLAGYPQYIPQRIPKRKQASITWK